MNNTSPVFQEELDLYLNDIKDNNLLDRTFFFELHSIKFLRTLPRDLEYRLVTFQ